MILIISCVFPPESVVSAQISNDLANVLSIKNDVVVICPPPSRPAGVIYYMEEDEQKPFNRIVLKSYVHAGTSFIGRMIESICFGLATKRFIRQHHSGISVIYANTWPLFAQYFAVKASHKYQIPIVIHIQDIYPETLTDRLDSFGLLLKSLLMPMDRYVLKHSKSVVAIGHKMAEYLSITRKVEKEKLSVINNWQDESRFTTHANIKKTDEAFTFLYLGSISPSANVESLINAFGLAGMKDKRLIIAGNGNSKQSCINRAQTFPDQKIDFIEAPASKTPGIIAFSDVCLLPLKKGFGRYSIPSKLPGYMLAGKPVLAYVDEDSDAANTIKLAECGWVVQPDDNEALIEKMQGISSMPTEDLKKLGENGRAYALKHLSKEANLKKLVEIVQQAAL